MEFDFEKVCEELGIGEYALRIKNSHSKGDQSHLGGYADILLLSRDVDNFSDWFLKQFNILVHFSQMNMETPDVIFQHIPTIITDRIKKDKKS